MITLCHKELNLLTLGDEQAKALGVNLKRARWIILIGTSFAVGGSVSISGVIGFVGLIVPHIFRALAGPNHKYLIILCILGGAIFLMLMDLAARTLMQDPIPVGVLTSLIGAPFFIYIMKKKKTDFW
jgi:iron complex transport system permease protein